ncbi:MAG: sugar transferase [Armatimonadota bacterium]|nr:MAG: sugar transferase [Armatimonadota bacterium]
MCSRRKSSLGICDAVKRLADIIVAGLGLLASTPLWLVIATAIMLDDGWPILYCQRRAGRGRRVFPVYKFRTMIKDAEKHSGAVLAAENDPRITRVGRILRKTALDEIPQLISIFKGDMSWVGPRPERPEFVREFLRDIPDYGLRYQVRPGLTGPAQVYARYYTDAVDKLRYDLYYVSNRSLWLDLKLFIRSWLITSKGRWDSSSADR